MEAEIDIFLPFWWMKDTHCREHGETPKSGSTARAAWRNAPGMKLLTLYSPGMRAYFENPTPG